MVAARGELALDKRLTLAEPCRELTDAHVPGSEIRQGGFLDLAGKYVATEQSGPDETLHVEG